MRSFDGRLTTSRQEITQRGDLAERFGPMLVAVNVKADANGLLISPRKAWLAGLPLPTILLPGGCGRESATGDQYRFHVEIAWFGRLVVRYAGHLEYEGAASR